VISCPEDISVECGEDTSPANTGSATATDGCGTATITFSDNTADDCGNTQIITRTWTATDECGNTATCIQTITVADTTPPLVECPADITVGNDLGICGAVVSYSIIGVDNCGTVTITQTDGLPSGSMFPFGSTTNTFNITDTCGNITTCSFDVTVNDTEAPVAVCNDFIAQLDATGNVSISAGDVIGNSVDNCSVLTTSVSPSSFTCTDIGPNTVTLTVTDEAGNSSTCSAIVTVEDNIDPTAICQDLTIQLDVNGIASITPEQVDNGSTDACGIQSLDVFPDSFDTGDLGLNSVTLTVTDNNGNVSTCNAIVTVEDYFSVEEFDFENEVILYPNPTSDIVILSNPQEMLLDKADIYDLTGRLVQSVPLIGMGAETVINISHLASAPYLIIIHGEGGRIIKQLIKE
jgi:uncharacterized protein YrzB (UPF0473 family)